MPGFETSLPPAPYDVLFEPVAIGPLITKNRFFQVPHCNGMGYRDPTAQAAMRKVKAEGGWAVVSTEQVEIHPTSDITPFIELRIWDDRDLPALALIAAAIHDGGALATIELCHNGLNAPNLYSRETPMGPHHLPVASYGCDPVQARMMRSCASAKRSCSASINSRSSSRAVSLSRRSCFREAESCNESPLIRSAAATGWIWAWYSASQAG